MIKEIKETIEKQYTDYLIREKLEKVRNFVTTAWAEKQKTLVADNIRFTALSVALSSLSSHLQSNFPGLSFHGPTSMLEDAVRQITADYPESSENVLSGNCYVGSAFKRQADYLRDFSDTEQTLGQRIHKYFFDYSGEEINDLIHLEHVEFLTANLCASLENEGIYKDVRVLSQTLVQSDYEYLNNPKPEINTSGPRVMIKTPAGLTTVSQISKLELFPEIKKDLQTFVLNELLKFGVSKTTFSVAYGKLFKVLESLHDFYTEIDRTYSYNENIGYLTKEGYPYIGSKTRVEISGSKEGVSLFLEYSDTRIVYKNEPDLLPEQKMKFTSQRNGDYDYIDMFEPYLFSAVKSPQQLMEFEINVLPRIDLIVTLINDFIQTRRAEMNENCGSE